MERRDQAIQIGTPWLCNHPSMIRLAGSDRCFYLCSRPGVVHRPVDEIFEVASCVHHFVTLLPPNDGLNRMLRTRQMLYHLTDPDPDVAPGARPLRKRTKRDFLTPSPIRHNKRKRCGHAACWICQPHVDYPKPQ